MTTLESAIRQIDRESRELLQQTFDIVNDEFREALSRRCSAAARRSSC